TMRRRGVRPRSDGVLRRDAVRSRRTTNRAPAGQRLTLARRERRYPMNVRRIGKGAQVAAATALLLSGCTALTREVLVDERARPTNATTVSHCSGSEWQDNSMMAVVPIPIIGFGMPTQQTNEIKADNVLSKCGPPDRLVN